MYMNYSYVPAAIRALFGFGRRSLSIAATRLWICISFRRFIRSSFFGCLS